MARIKSTKTKKTNKNKSTNKDFSLDNLDNIVINNIPFIEAYMECFNGRLAYLTVHPDATANVASVSANRLLSNPKIRKELERRFSELTMGKHEVLERLKAIANATLLPFIKIEEDGHVYFNFNDSEAKKHLYLIRKLKSKKSETVNIKSDEATEEKWIEVELHDSMKALELLGKYHVLFTDKTEHTERKIIRVVMGNKDA